MTPEPSSQTEPAPCVGSTELLGRFREHRFELASQLSVGICAECNRWARGGWTRKVSYEYDEWDLFHERCAIKRMDRDEAEWALYTPEAMAKFDAEMEAEWEREGRLERPNDEAQRRGKEKP